MDNLFTGQKENLNKDVKFYEVDICDEKIRKVIEDEKPDYVFHLAAVASVPRSVDDPKNSLDNNVMGTLKLLLACRDFGVKRVMFASSSSVYGDDPSLSKKEAIRGKVLSPYALSKKVGEDLMRLFYELYGLETVALRYFNVFGPRQNPEGPYAAVIPIFTNNLIEGIKPTIFGDGKQSRDFTYVKNVVEGNILFAGLPADKVAGKVFNLACGGRVSLNELVEKLNKIIGTDLKADFKEERKGDIKHSCADITKAKSLGFKPSVNFEDGLKKTVEYYKTKSK